MYYIKNILKELKSNAYKQMEELVATLPATIEQKEKQLEMLAKEKEIFLTY